MAPSVHERLKAVRASLKLSQKDFSRAIFLEKSAYTRMELGQTKVNDRIIELVCLKYRVNKGYLKAGEGPMFTENGPSDVKLEQLRQIFDALNPLFQDYLILHAQELFKVQEKEEQRVKGASPSAQKAPER
jgi:transcriptional regulator with XRE-family HTH domain